MTKPNERPAWFPENPYTSWYDADRVWKEALDAVMKAADEHGIVFVEIEKMLIDYLTTSQHFSDLIMPTKDQSFSFEYNYVPSLDEEGVEEPVQTLALNGQTRKITHRRMSDEL